VDIKTKLSDEDFHAHLLSRMEQRGISRAEIEITLSEGWPATDTKDGTLGKVHVFDYNKDWEGNVFEAKEVTVYYKFKDGNFVLLTAKARYGKNFAKGR